MSSNLSDLTKKEKLNLLKNGDPEDLLARNFNLDGLISSDLVFIKIPLVILLAEPEKISDFYTKLSPEDTRILFLKVTSGDIISLDNKIIVDIFLACNYSISLFPDYNYSADLEDKFINLDKSMNILNEKLAIKVIMKIVNFCYNKITDLTMYLLDYYIKDFNPVLSQAIRYGHISLVNYLLEKLDDFDDSVNIIDFELEIMDALYEKTKDKDKTVRFYIKTLYNLRSCDACPNIIEITMMYKMFLKHYDPDEIVQIIKKF